MEFEDCPNQDNPSTGLWILIHFGYDLTLNNFVIMILIIVSLATYGHLIIVSFFYNKLTLTILCCVVGTNDDCELSFMGVDEQQ